MSQVERMKVSQTRPGSMFVEWNPSSKTHSLDSSDFSKYVVEVKKGSDGVWQKVTEVDRSKGFVDLNDLDSDEEYSVRLVPDVDYSSNFFKRAMRLDTSMKLKKTTGI